MTQIKSHIPKLRFSEFSCEWEEKKLWEIATFSKWKWLSKSDIMENWKYKCIHYWELFTKYWPKINNIFSNTNIEWKLVFSEWNETLMPTSDITPNWLATWSSIFEKNVILWWDILIIKSNVIYNLFFSYYISSHKNDIMRLVSWSTVYHLYGSDMKTLKINLPSFHEQQKIASFLSSVDEKIEKIKEKKKNLEDYKKWISQKFFSQEIRFKDEDWKEFGSWKNIKLWKYLKQKSIRNKENQVKLVLSISNKKWFITQSEQFDGYEVASKNLTTYKIVKKWDYAYNPSRINVGSISRLKNYDTWIVSPMYIVFELLEWINPIFFDNLYKTYNFIHLIKIWCSGSVRDSLNFEVMANFKIKLPPILEQQKIADFLSWIDDKIENVDNEIKKMEKFKKGLLQNMFV